MKTPLRHRASLATVIAVILTGCSAVSIVPPLNGDAGSEDGGGACDTSKCAAGNQCISDGKETKCRLVCTVKEDGTGGQSACPLNYHCAGAAVPYCAADKFTYTKSDKGQWGAPCLASDGIFENPACDVAQNFWCYGVSPVDASPFCTQYECTGDADCRGGWWCATVNSAPNIERKARSVGEVNKVCMPRTYCASCTTDIDCPMLKGVKQHCVEDDGGAKYCTAECSADSNCNNEAKCAQNDAAGTTVCQPRAGTCKGDGTLCSPCLSDADCPAGVCAGSPYSTERYCTVKSTVPCKANATGGITAACPKTNVAKVPVTCATKEGSSDPSLPKDHCFGLVSFGSGSSKGNVPGCYTPAR